MKKLLLCCMLAVAALSVGAAERQDPYKLPPIKVYGSAGGSMWTTPLYMPDGSHTPTLTGRELQAGISVNCYGIYTIGAVYSSHYAPYTYLNTNCYAGIDFAGVTFGMRGKMAAHWVVDLSCGLGWVQYADGVVDYDKVTTDGTGIFYSLGVDYMLTDHLALGADVQYLVVNLGKSDPDS